MVEIGSHRNALAQHVIGRELYHGRTGSTGRLGKILFDTANERLVFTEREIGIERQVVAHTGLRTPQFQNGVEIGNLITKSYRKVGRRGLHNLTGSRI